MRSTLPGSLTGAQAEYVVSDLIATSADTVRIKGTPLELRIDTSGATLLIPHKADRFSSRIIKSAGAKVHFVAGG